MMQTRKKSQSLIRWTRTGALRPLAGVEVRDAELSAALSMCRETFYVHEAGDFDMDYHKGSYIKAGESYFCLGAEGLGLARIKDIGTLDAC